MNEEGFTLDDFKSQLRQVLQPGLMMRMLPGMGEITAMMKGEEVEAEMRRMLGIIDSMTAKERRNPNLIDRNRHNRIARGAGVQVQDVHALLRQFDMMSPIMKAMAKGDIRRYLNSIPSIDRSDRWRFGL